MKEKINQWLKALIKKTPLYIPLRNKLSKRRQLQELAAWQLSGGKLPTPHLIKQKTLVSLSQQFKLSTLVETGTYFGDMIESMKDRFDQIYSIELNGELFALAQKRFKHEDHVSLLHGDSGREIKYILQVLTGPALFWLDAHYSAGITARADKDTPILEELSYILKDSHQHVVVIDDARCFGTDAAYPSIDKLKSFALDIRPGAEIVIKDDSIRIYPTVS